jgi:extracellular elastinolytic metalloproteinase
MNGSATSPNIGIGNWLNNGVSLRRHPFSTNMAINPTTYGLINTDYWEWHDIGEIWGNILYGVYWALQQATGKFCNDWHTPGTTCANSLVIRMVIESLKLLPCNPSFVDGRNALLQAEQLLTHGKHECAIWRVFAKRGVGVDAVYGPWHIDEGFALPTTCQ